MPLKAKDLRIGNLIYICGNTLDTYQTYYPRVVSVDIIREISEENEERPDAMLSAFNPIPLTEDWLVKFGFEKSKARIIGNRYTFGINPRTEDYIIIINQVDTTKQEFFYQNSFFDIKYVHQLQNLYYALTGTELNITP